MGSRARLIETSRLRHAEHLTHKWAGVVAIVFPFMSRRAAKNRPRVRPTGSGTRKRGQIQAITQDMTGVACTGYMTLPLTPHSQPFPAEGGCFRSKRLRHFVLACGSSGGDVWFHRRPHPMRPAGARPHQRQDRPAPHCGSRAHQPCTNPVNPQMRWRRVRRKIRIHFARPRHTSASSAGDSSDARYCRSAVLRWFPHC